MKKELYKSRFLIAAMIVSTLGIFGSVDLSFKITFFVLNILTAVMLVNRFRKV